MALSKKLKTALDETRMLMLGAQILLGFGLRSVFADGFDQLPRYTIALDGIGLGLMVIVVGLLIAPGPYHRIVEGGADSGSLHGLVTDIPDLAVMLLMAPAAYHRIVYAGEDTDEMHRTGSMLITLATVPLALGLTGDLYVVIAKIADPAVGLTAAACALILLIGLWYAYPLAAALLRERRAAAGRGSPAKAAGQSR